MNNLDSMVLSKLPFNIHQPNRGYSHNTQLYNFFNKNIKFVLSSRIKSQTMRFVKKKSLLRPVFNFRKVGRRVMTRPTAQTRTTSLTLITLANTHYLTHTMLMPWPHVRGNATRRRLAIAHRVKVLRSAKLLSTLRAYERLLTEDLLHNTLY